MKGERTLRGAILLPMQIDPVQEWQRITAEYREKSPEELLELARDFGDLTETAQQALRTEMRSRGLGDPERPRFAAELQQSRNDASAPLALRNLPCDGGTTSDTAFDTYVGRTPELVPDNPDTGNEDDGPHEYTWKTVLCECETPEQARQLSEALKLAGIDNWIEHPGATSRHRGSALAYPRIVVAADQLEEARAIAAQPIPQEIIEDSKIEEPDYEEPRCPKCGAEDPILEAVEPTNHWRCEVCEAEWDDQAEGAAANAEKADDRAR